jgi:hypothetical protein
LFGGSVRREDGMFEDMEEEMEWFDEPPSFNDLCGRLNAKFGGDFTLRGRFDPGKNRAHYILVPLRSPREWDRYKSLVQGSNMPIAEVVVENGYRLEDEEDNPCNDGGGVGAQEFGVEEEGNEGDMDVDGQLTQEVPHSHPEGLITDDFDVNDFEREEEERDEDIINDDDSSDDDDDDDDDDQGVTDAVPTSVLHAMPTQGGLVHELPEEDRPYDSWGRISEAQHYVPPPQYTPTELRQMSEGGMPFTGVPNYRDVSMVDMADCDTGLMLCNRSLHNHEELILRKGMVFNTMSEMKLFLQDYAVFHHRPYFVTHSNKNLKYHIRCKNANGGGLCLWQLNARKRKSDGKWKVSKVVQPHTCLTNRGQQRHRRRLHVILHAVYWGSLIKITTSPSQCYKKT